MKRSGGQISEFAAVGNGVASAKDAKKCEDTAAAGIDIDIDFEKCTDTDREAAWNIYIDLNTSHILESIAEIDDKCNDPPIHIINTMSELIRTTRDTIKTSGVRAERTATAALAMINDVLHPVVKQYGGSSTTYLGDPYRHDQMRTRLCEMGPDLSEFSDIFYRIATSGKEKAE